MDLNHLETFALVAQRGTLSAAARARGVPTSTISRHITRLEAALGVDLLHRGARQVTLTAAGAEVLARSRHPLRELRDLTTGLSVGKPRGTLRLSAPSNLAIAPWFAAILVRFQQMHRAVNLDVDFTSWRLDPIKGGFDVCFCPLDEVVDSPDLIVRRLTSATLQLYANADYVARNGRPRTVHELPQYDMISARILEGRPLTLHHDDQTVHIQPRVVAIGDDLSFVLSMVHAGAGYAVLPEIDGSQRESSALVEFLPGWTLSPLHPAMVWPRRRFEVPRVRAFVDFVIAEFERASMGPHPKDSDTRTKPPKGQ